jgi:hypothetical protein
MKSIVVPHADSNPRPAEQRPPINLAAAVYGQVLASSQVAALSLDESLDSAAILLALTGTILVFWLAHVYARTVADRVEFRAAILPDLVAAMRFEWPIVEAAAPAAFALTLGIVGVLSTENSVLLAIGLGALNLFVWGLAIGRRLKLGKLVMLGLAFSNALFGLIVIVMKVAVH